ncbi:hypothetical protein L1276_003845 [Flavobacterium sp. HSC-32F16]|nr:hypothetical protein [Flavobacterium sp. HSC-32F16]
MKYRNDSKVKYDVIRMLRKSLEKLKKNSAKSLV